MTETQARRFADHWLRAWNDHDAEAILDHYAPDVVYTSSLLPDAPECTLLGREAVGAYIRAGLRRFPDLRFRPQTVFVGPGALVLTFTSVDNRRAAEFCELNRDGKIRRVVAHHQTPAAGGAVH